MCRLMTILFAAAALTVGSLVAAADEPLMKQIQTIPLPGVEGRFDHFGVDVEGKRLYVAALGNNTLEVIDLDAGKRIKSISGLKKPTGIRVLAGSRNAVVASGGDGQGRVYEPAEFNIAGTGD